MRSFSFFVSISNSYLLVLQVAHICLLKYLTLITKLLNTKTALSPPKQEGTVLDFPSIIISDFSNVVAMNELAYIYILVSGSQMGYILIDFIRLLNLLTTA